MITFIKWFLVLFTIILIVGLSQQREMVNLYLGQAKRSMGFQSEIYHWNTSVAWEKTDREHDLLETGNFVQREFPFLDYMMRARKNKDGTTLAAVYFTDGCLEGASIITDELDFNEEPFEMRCVSVGETKGWRVGARLPPGESAWYETYEGFAVRANFEDWDFNIIQKYSGALEMQPDQVTN